MQFPCGCYDLLLVEHYLALTAATAAATLLLIIYLGESRFKRSYFNKIHVCLFRVAYMKIIFRLYIIGNYIAWLQVIIFEQEQIRA